MWTNLGFAQIYPVSVLYYCVLIEILYCSLKLFIGNSQDKLLVFLVGRSIQSFRFFHLIINLSDRQNFKKT